MAKFGKYILIFTLFQQFNYLYAHHYIPVYSGFPYSPMSILITGVTVDSKSIEPGDEIGVFDGTLCVGSAIYNGSMPIDVISSMDDPTTMAIDGFTYNHSISFRIWKTDSSLEYKDVAVKFDSGFDDVFKPFGTAFASLTVAKGISIFSFPDQTFEIPENSPVNTKIGTLTASYSGVFSFSLLSGVYNGVFGINSVTGELYVHDQSRLDYEATRAFSLKVKLTSILDPSVSDTANVNVILENINEPPVGNVIISDTAHVDVSYNRFFTFLDPEGQQVSIYPVNLPLWMQMQNVGDGGIVLKGTPEIQDTGKFIVALAVSDGVNTVIYSYPCYIFGNLSPVIVNNNPSNGNFTVSIDTKFPGDVLIMVRQLNGSPVFSQILKSGYGKIEVPVNLTGMSGNIYLMVVKVGDKIFTNKLIVQ